MSTEKTLKLTILTISTVFFALVGKKIYSTKAHRAKIRLAQVQEQPAKSTRAPSSIERQHQALLIESSAKAEDSMNKITLMKERLGDSEIGKAAFDVLSSTTFCKVQENCAHNLYQLYSHALMQTPLEQNENLLISFQRKIKASDLSLKEQQLVFATFLQRLGEYNQKDSLLIEASLKNYLDLNPHPRVALEVVMKAFEQSKDPFITGLARSLIVQAYPQYSQAIEKYFASSKLAGS